MYVILGCHLKCNFGEMAKLIKSLANANLTGLIHSDYVIHINFKPIKVSGDTYVS
jgi:hypothetical protein